MNLAAESLANAPRRYEALRAISLIRGDAANAVSCDVGMIRGNDHELRAIAIDQVAYGDEGDGRSAAIPALLEAMGDDSPKVRALAASGLRLILDEETGARAALERTARRAESPLRERAAEILQAGPRQRESFGGSVSPPPAAPAPASGK
jgi:hypothetical protein